MVMWSSNWLQKTPLAFEMKIQILMVVLPMNQVMKVMMKVQTRQPNELSWMTCLNF